MTQSDFSRSGFTDPLGKLTAELPKVRVPEATLEAVEREARKVGLSTSEWLRHLVQVRVHGVDMLAKIEADRLKAVAGMRSSMGDSE